MWVMSSPALKFINSPPADVPELEHNVRFVLNNFNKDTTFIKHILVLEHRKGRKLERINHYSS
jgi:hypothetical protein